MDAAFLSSVPPIQGIRRAVEGGGVDELDQSTIKQWKDRLAVIFQEMLIAKPHYLQLRFIGVADEGKEIVRVEWKGSRLERTGERLLQSKKNESYFRESMKTPPGQVYLSEFSLNREWGKIENPPKMVLRAAVPIPDADNKIFGIVIINMLAKKALSGLLSLHQTDELSILYDSQLQSLITLSSKGNWRKSKMDDTSDRLLEFLKKATREDPLQEGKVDSYHVVAKKIFYDSLIPARFLGIATRTPLDQVYNKVYNELSYKTPFSFLIVILAMVIMYVFIQRQIRPIQSLRILAKRLSQGEDVPRPDWLDSKHDELSELTAAIYKMAEDINKSSILLKVQKEALDAIALVSETDRKGRIVYANKKFIDITGFSKEDLIGSTHRIINSSYHPNGFFEGLWKTIASGKVWRGEVKNRRKDGSYYWVDSSIVPYRNKNGRIEKYISIRMDITDKKKQEEELKELTEAKTKFLAVMSHEIRTPLGAVIGLCQLLASTSLSDQQKRYVENIGSSAEMLLSILNDILDLSKLNSGKIQLHIEAASVAKLSQGITNIFREKALEKKIELNVDVSDKVPVAIEIDTVRFKQILLNLVSNAIKFTHKGYVRIKFDYLKEQSRFRLIVEDSGIGMTAQQMEQVFDEFVQADSSTTKDYGGTGLGLPICKKTAEAMGGSITVASIKDKGSTFTVDVPAHECKEPVSERHEKVLGNLPMDLKILLADDYPINQTIFAKMMEDIGISVTLVENGALALHEVEQKEFDLIFLDIQMPVMDGIEACRRIRDLNKAKRPWIVALTANAFHEDVEKYRLSGFDDYVPKPFNKKSIQKAFANFSVKKAIVDGYI